MIFVQQSIQEGKNSLRYAVVDSVIYVEPALELVITKLYKKNYLNSVYGLIHPGGEKPKVGHFCLNFKH